MTSQPKTYRERQEDRLQELKQFLAAEEASPNRSQLYVNDLELSIHALLRGNKNAA